MLDPGVARTFTILPLLSLINTKAITKLMAKDKYAIVSTDFDFWSPNPNVIILVSTRNNVNPHRGMDDRVLILVENI